MSYESGVHASAKRGKPRNLFLLTALSFGYAFLYLPILWLVIYSFNANKMMTVWGGFSTHWYGALFENEALMMAAKNSLLVAFSSATLAVIVGTLGGLGLTRLGRFKGRTLLAALTSMPLVMPEVMLGLSALLLFVSLESLFPWWPARGLGTITIAHVTLCSCYVTVVVQSRLSQMDDSLEEAAMDLGARPWRVFMQITLPLILPSLIAGWLLAFTLSLDDFVVASFTSGPGATTLPMAVYSKVRLGLSPEVNALATMIVGVVTSALILTYCLLGREQKSQRS
jgi:putrescine transport system permease protein